MICSQIKFAPHLIMAQKAIVLGRRCGNATRLKKILNKLQRSQNISYHKNTSKSLSVNARKVSPWSKKSTSKCTHCLLNISNRSLLTQRAIESHKCIKEIVASTRPAIKSHFWPMSKLEPAQNIESQLISADEPEHLQTSFKLHLYTMIWKTFTVFSATLNAQKH